MENKQCAKCKEVRPVSDFWKYRQTRDGYNRYCVFCHRPNAGKGVNFAKTGRKKSRNMPKTLAKFGISTAFIHHLMDKCRTRSSCRGQETDVDALWIIEKVDEFCSQNYFQISTKNPFQPSLDRIDNSKGYMKDNLKVCWLIENYCKNTFSDDSVIEFCKRKLGLL